MAQLHTGLRFILKGPDVAFDVLLTSHWSTG